MDTAVGLVKGYLELCGYFVLAELPVREAGRHGYRDVTDLDVLAVRFPHRASTAGPARKPLDLFLGSDLRLGPATDCVDVLIGEVKQGKARVNPALRRRETIAFALRRVGCCPEERLGEHVAHIAASGSARMSMAGGTPCRVRIVAFGGSGHEGAPGIPTVALAHCLAWVRDRLASHVAQGIQLEEPALAFLALESKLQPPTSSSVTTAARKPGGTPS